MAVAILTAHASQSFANVRIVGMGEQGPVFGMPGLERTPALMGAPLAVA